MSPSVREKINKVINSVIQGATPLRSKALLNLQQIALRTLANKTILQRINMELIKKQKRQRGGQGKTSYGKARVLSVREALQKNQEREQKEQVEAAQKERRMALRGVIGFAKKVWKELPMQDDLFV